MTARPSARRSKHKAASPTCRPSAITGSASRSAPSSTVPRPRSNASSESSNNDMTSERQLPHRHPALLNSPLDQRLRFYGLALERTLARSQPTPYPVSQRQGYRRMKRVLINWSFSACLISPTKRSASQMIDEGHVDDRRINSIQAPLRLRSTNFKRAHASTLMEGFEWQRLAPPLTRR